MSASTASRGTPGRVNGTDIIDLDRYMSAAVRPSRHRPQHTRERLIVDAGGVNRTPVDLSSSTDSSLLQSRTYTRSHCKQYSHDSGMSDGSYLRQRYRPQRRVSMDKSTESSRAVGSNSSVREFKAACEKALREQQQQIARVAELCEKLVQPQIAQNFLQTATPNMTNIGQNVCPNNSPQVAQTFNCMSQNTNQFGQHLKSGTENTKCVKQNFGQSVSQVRRVNQHISSCTSDLTSSSYSTRNGKIRDRHRSDSCKTYKLIIGKLDELSQLFAVRRVPVQTQPVRGSSGSVSMSDKVVATDDLSGRNFDTVKVLHTTRLNGRVQPNIDQSIERHQLKTTGTQQEGQATNHIVGDSCRSVNGSFSDDFDLDNPLHTAKTLRTAKSKGDQFKDTGSVCALCRGYWRIIRQYFKQ
ncbi:uncharacterized protein LOC126779005 [Nymphalis io]|uniref:uncharacterized protein LOC126779005 n=1 Tax=Inachis io TaxID=171585 RepID=UPI002167291E|nr:uncharacterized protein LOC126779005 [Nymphalis io]